MVTGSTKNNGIFRETVECLLSSGIKTHGHRLFFFIDLFPPYFIKLYLNIHPKSPLKSDTSIWAGPNPFTFWSANFLIKLGHLILYKALVYTSTLKSSLKDISNFRYSKQNIITLIFVFYYCTYNYSITVYLILTWVSNEYVHIYVVICIWKQVYVICMKLICGGFPFVYICLDTRNRVGSIFTKLTLPYFVACQK